ncbi:flavin reductase family protein [Gordonia jinghuaiqii]|nr:flavin reductase family protein [Gordonia jinghuaiqii]
MSQVDDIPRHAVPSTFGDSASAMASVRSHSVEIMTAFSAFPAAVGALCAVVDGEPRGLAATSLAVGVSYAPPMVSFSVRNESTTWPILSRADRIGISVLTEDQGPVCRKLAGQDGDRFAGLDTTVTPGGALFVNDASTWMECAIAGTAPAGDHTIVTFEVLSVGHERAASPLIFRNNGFLRLR